MFHVRRLLLTQSSLSISKHTQAISHSINISKSTGLSKVLANSYTNLSKGSAPEKVASDSSNLIISDSCVKRLKDLGNIDQYLRVSVDSGGCSGLEYKFLLDSKITNEDKLVTLMNNTLNSCDKDLVNASNNLKPYTVTAHRVIEKEGCKIVVDNESLGFIKGSTIDFYEELIRQGFRVINNPNSESGCSCGASFSIKI